MVERKGAYRVLVGKPKGNRPLERPRLRRDCNIKIDIGERLKRPHYLSRVDRERKI
jgi:hypothetical protein